MASLTLTVPDETPADLFGEPTICVDHLRVVKQLNGCGGTQSNKLMEGRYGCQKVFVKERSLTFEQQHQILNEIKMNTIVQEKSTFTNKRLFVKYYGWTWGDECRSIVWLVFDYVENKWDPRNATADENRRYLLDCVRALAVLYEEMGIIHGDVKPENVMVNEGHAMLTDFGCAYMNPCNWCRSQRYRYPSEEAASAMSPMTDLYAIGYILLSMMKTSVEGAIEGPNAFAKVTNMIKNTNRDLERFPSVTPRERFLKTMLATLLCREEDERGGMHLLGGLTFIKREQWLGAFIRSQEASEMVAHEMVEELQHVDPNKIGLATWVWIILLMVLDSGDLKERIQCSSVHRVKTCN